jgi:AcrR family transcriptional regulator
MKGKKLQIVLAAIHLLAKGDYHSTSIQDIADMAGVAKGSFYLHFRSKEDLLIAIYQYFFDRFNAELEALSQDASLTARERMIGAFHIQWKMIAHNVDMLSLHLKNSVFFQTEPAKQLICSGTLQALSWMEGQIIEHYGPGIQKNAFECAVLANGMFKEYVFTHLYLGVPIEHHDMAAILFDRLDDIVQGALRKERAPLLTSASLLGHMTASPQDILWPEALESLKTSIAKMIQDPQLSVTLMQSIDALAEESQKAQPNLVIMNGMYNYVLMLVREEEELSSQIRLIFSSKLQKTPDTSI